MEFLDTRPNVCRVEVIRGDIEGTLRLVTDRVRDRPAPNARSSRAIQAAC
jgi:hypothetical protein